MEEGGEVDEGGAVDGMGGVAWDVVGCTAVALVAVEVTGWCWESDGCVMASNADLQQPNRCGYLTFAWRSGDGCECCGCTRLSLLIITQCQTQWKTLMEVTIGRAG